MKFNALMIGVASATLLAGAASAYTISALDDLGNVYNLSIATDGTGATATKVASVPDPETIAGEEIDEEDLEEITRWIREARDEDESA